MIGISTHDIEQAKQAVLAGADYLGVGPTFPSKTKEFEEFAGLEFVSAVAAEISLPAFAIGGINQHNVSQVASSGITRVAMQHALESDQVAEIAKDIRNQLTSAPLPSNS